MLVTRQKVLRRFWCPVMPMRDLAPILRRKLAKLLAKHGETEQRRI